MLKKFLVPKRKNQLTEDQHVMLDKLGKRERLAYSEPCSVNELIHLMQLMHQQGPKMKYSNPDDWIGHDE